MLQQAFTRYINNFRGFSREVWILAVITFINRAGTMVLPFLSKYLKEDLHFSYSQVGTVMVCFGFGSMIGSWLGGKLSDRIGFYRIMVFSLFTSGALFFVIQYIRSFEGMCMAMFSIMVIADMFRPAMFVSLSTYAKPENRTRAFTLVRLAVNLGFAAGPALGGLIILGIGYRGLFWADGASCIISILIFSLLVKEKKKEITDRHLNDDAPQRSAMRDIPFLLFLFSSFTTAFIFFQLFTTLPLYHKEWYGLTEVHTGLLMSLNGLLIFLLEMPIVGFFERKNVQKVKIILWGALFMAISFFVLLINVWVGILLVSLIFMTIGEMFCFPFSNSFAMGRAPRGHEGKYMGLYTMTFSLAHITSAKTGMGIIALKGNVGGYQANWLFMGVAGMLAVGALLLLQKMLIKENS
ncbi:MFS transporter [Flavobacterium cyanobacteriorum]|uniref:MFS transporter n=1 Tax=Flavobacterium cyanobacteriorum TaxID=2022802 RepID=A0A255ZQG0_9FLAO|nr:MFS transporter [Flavobacterium cyanobacteriorum]OYQ43632.1 MFS transporter [Flavobacterium cyanobacteriorum]